MLELEDLQLEQTNGILQYSSFFYINGEKHFARLIEDPMGHLHWFYATRATNVDENRNYISSIQTWHHRYAKDVTLTTFKDHINDYIMTL